MTEYPSGYPPPGQPPPHRPYGQADYGTQPYETQPYGRYAPGWRPTPEGPRRLDGWSVAGLVCGILPTVVLGLAFSVVGLVRTGNPVRRGRAFAVAGVVLSLAWVAALGAYADRLQATTPAVTVHWYDLAVGDCFLLPPMTGQTTRTTVDTVLKVSCKQLHNAQMVATVQPYNADYPGDSTILDQSVAMCRTAVVNFLNRPLGRLRYAAIAPGQTQWEAGYKNGSCLLFDPARNVKGDIRKDR